LSVIKSENMKRTRIKSISEKRKAEMAEYKQLEKKLRILCGNRSELSGDYADWRTHWDVEGHHINGRNGKRLLDPFNIIMLTRHEHDREEGNIRGEPPTDPQKLLEIVRKIRIAQGFKEA